MLIIEIYFVLLYLNYAEAQCHSNVFLSAKPISNYTYSNKQIKKVALNRDERESDSLITHKNVSIVHLGKVNCLL